MGCCAAKNQKPPRTCVGSEHNEKTGENSDKNEIPKSEEETKDRMWAETVNAMSAPQPQLKNSMMNKAEEASNVLGATARLDGELFRVEETKMSVEKRTILALRVEQLPVDAATENNLIQGMLVSLQQAAPHRPQDPVRTRWVEVGAPSTCLDLLPSTLSLAGTVTVLACIGHLLLGDAEVFSGLEKHLVHGMTTTRRHWTPSSLASIRDSAKPHIRELLISLLTWTWRILVVAIDKKRDLAKAFVAEGSISLALAHSYDLDNVSAGRPEMRAWSISAVRALASASEAFTWRHLFLSNGVMAAILKNLSIDSHWLAIESALALLCALQRLIPHVTLLLCVEPVPAVPLAKKRNSLASPVAPIGQIWKEVMRILQQLSSSSHPSQKQPRPQPRLSSSSRSSTGSNDNKRNRAEDGNNTISTKLINFKTPAATRSIVERTLQLALTTLGIGATNELELLLPTLVESFGLRNLCMEIKVTDAFTRSIAECAENLLALIDDHDLGNANYNCSKNSHNKEADHVKPGE